MPKNYKPKVTPPANDEVVAGKVAKRNGHGRIIKSFTKDGREYHLHATKGWRSYRAV